MAILNGARAAGDLSIITVTSFPSHPEYAGKTLAEVTAMNGREPMIENGAEVAMEILHDGGGSAIYHRMSGMPASRINFMNRGTLAKGMTADVLIFDPETGDDNEDWAHPHQYATGFSYVILKGPCRLYRRPIVSRQWCRRKPLISRVGKYSSSAQHLLQARVYILKF
jgi:N-acyl-D-aspartate/D-glutamate deacylase